MCAEECVLCVFHGAINSQRDPSLTLSQPVAGCPHVGKHPKRPMDGVCGCVGLCFAFLCFSWKKYGGVKLNKCISKSTLDCECGYGYGVSSYNSCFRCQFPMPAHKCRANLVAVTGPIQSQSQAEANANANANANAIPMPCQCQCQCQCQCNANANANAACKRRLGLLGVCPHSPGTMQAWTTTKASGLLILQQQVPCTLTKKY